MERLPGGIKSCILYTVYLICLLDIQMDIQSRQLYVCIWSSTERSDRVFIKSKWKILLEKYTQERWRLSLNLLCRLLCLTYWSVEKTGQCEGVIIQLKTEILSLICLFDAPTNLAQVVLQQKPYDWQLLAAENDHNQENNNMALANEDVKHSTNSVPDALVC